MNDLNDAVAKAMEKASKKEAESQLRFENEMAYKEVVNRIFSTEDGKYFAKYLLKFCNVHGTEQSRDGVALVENNAKRSVYYRLVRGYLDKEVLTQIEVYND